MAPYHALTTLRAERVQPTRFRALPLLTQFDDANANINAYLFVQNFPNHQTLRARYLIWRHHGPKGRKAKSDTALSAYPLWK